MTQINPLAGAIAQTPQAQRLAAADRDAQVRKTLAKEKSSGFTDHKDDEFVESADAIAALGDEDAHKDPRQKKQRRRPPPVPPTNDDPAPHLDIRA